jgi:diguanylate cyclase (GGDEF)-like protein
MARAWKTGGIACLLWLLVAGSALARTPAVLDDDVRTIELSPYVQYHHDLDGRADATTMFARADAADFEPLPERGPTFKFQNGAFWFHAVLSNQGHSEGRWLLVQRYALSDRLDLYVRYPDGHVLHKASGDHLPFESRSVRYRQPNFWVEVPPGQAVDVLLRVQSQSSMQVPLALYTPTAFIEIERDAQLAIGIYYGILLSLFIYNLVLWLSLRDASYFWYLLHVSAFGLVLFTLNGLGFEYLWPDSAWLADYSVPLSICLAQIGMQQFSRTFLDRRQRWRIGDIGGMVLIAAFVLLGIASTQISIRTSTLIAIAGVFLSISWIVIETIVVLRRGYKPAQLFLLAWAMFLVGVAMFSAIALGLVPKNFVTEYGVQIGSAVEMLLLSIALGYRYASLRNENERIAREAKEQLERKVAARTAELSSTMAQLSDANAQLREYSRRDPLTSAFNRRHFREVFEQQLREGAEHGRPLALLMADLDNFKQINDTYGHLVGDDCLRAVARCFNEALQGHDAVVARFGGEEFVSLLPSLDAQQALQVAEVVRQRILDTPVYSGRRHVRLSISIGVHTITADRRITPEDALRLADEALYRAKNDGRNCVRHSVSVA